MNVVSILWDACLPSHFEQTSICRVPPAGGVYFSNIYAHAGDTITNTTSVMTGYDCFGHGISQLYYSLMDGGNSPYPKARAFLTLPMLLQAKGINTYLMGEDREWLRFGYSNIADLDIDNSEEIADAKKIKVLAEILPVELEPPFFLHLHLWSAHYAGQYEDIKVETIADKLKAVQKVDIPLRVLCEQLLRAFPDTIIVIWSDHGDTENAKGEIRHASILAQDVQHTWCLYMDGSDNYRTDSDLHAQADLFRLLGDPFDIDGVELEMRQEARMARYGLNPLVTSREKVWAGHWRRDLVARYERINGQVEFHCADYDEMLEADIDFFDHTKLYGHLMPINKKRPEVAGEWPHEKVTERLKALGYID